MDRRKRVFGQFGVVEGNKIQGLNLPELLRHLLLFEGVIVHGRFEEFGHFARTHGLDAAVALLKADGLILDTAIGMLGYKDKPVAKRTRGNVLRITNLDFGTVVPVGAQHYLDQSFSTVAQVSELTPGRLRKLENTIRGKLLPGIAVDRREALQQTEAELGRVVPAFHTALRLAFEKQGIVLPEQVRYRLDIMPDPRNYVVETDIHRFVNVSDEQIASVMAQAILGFGSLNYAIDDIRRHTALVGLPDREIEMLDSKLQFLAGELRPQEQVNRFSRVLAAAELPEIQADSRIDIEKLLEIRQSKEAKAFRDWLWQSDAIAVEEVRERIGNLKYRLGALVRGKPGKVVRWSASTGIGMVPVIGPVAGVIAGAIDSFLVEKVLPDRGALSFLGEQYPSLFER